MSIASISTTTPPMLSSQSLPLSKTHHQRVAAAAPKSPIPTLPTPPATAPSSHESDYEDIPTRPFTTSQALSNASFLYPGSQPMLLTSKDPNTNASTTLIIATNPATKILFSAEGTTNAAFEELLGMTELAVHEHLQSLAADDAPRSLPVRRGHRAHVAGLPKSRGAARVRALTIKKSELMDTSEMVSPRTLPIARMGRRAGIGMMLSGGGGGWVTSGEEAEAVKAWIRDVSDTEATPASLTMRLPRSRKFEGRQ